MTTTPTEPSTLPRRVFDKAGVWAYWRWELLRRDTSYRQRVVDLIELGAETFFSRHGRRWDTKRLSAFFLGRWGGVIDAPPTQQGQALHDEILNRYGLAFVVHHDLVIPLDDMMACPIFRDTPGRQPVVVNRARLRELAMRVVLGRDGLPVIPERPLRTTMRKRAVPRAGSWIGAQRIHLDTLRRDLDVFDLRCSGLSLTGAAERLGMSDDEAKRAWARAAALIPNHRTERWNDSPIDAHVSTCRACKPWAAGTPGAEPCQQMGRLLDPAPRRRGGQRMVGIAEALVDHRDPDRVLDLLAARSAGVLPTRSRRSK